MLSVKNLINILILSSPLLFISCSTKLISSKDPMDREAGLTRNEYEAGFTERDYEKRKGRADTKSAPIPSMSKIISSPKAPQFASDKLISFSVTEQVPIKDALIELARMAKLDIDIDSSISGGILINAQNRPLKEVLDRIAAAGSLRYTYDRGTIHFERDNPYLKNYTVGYLVEGSDLWKDVETNLNSLMNSVAATSSANSPAASSSQTEVKASAPAIPKSTISINKTAGIMTIYASKAQHDEISKYLAEIEKGTSYQILIEAKVVDVTLSKAFKFGIDWNLVGGLHAIPGGSFGELKFNRGTTDQISLSPSLYVFGGNLNANISLLDTFGTTRTVTSPRISTMNNQKATIKFDTKLIYFTIQQNVQQLLTPTGSTTSSTSQAVTVNATKQEESIGTELSIVPSINVKTNEITMSIKPKFTSQTGWVVDPTTSLSLNADPITGKAGATQVVNKVPVIETRQVDTLAKIKSGNVLVIGGLIRQSTDNKEGGIPLLSNIPFLGYLFKHVEKTTDITETVIFIKATIVGSGAQVNSEDRDFQQRYDSDKRRFF